MLKERLDNLQQYELESQEEFLARKLAAEKEYLDKKQALAKKEVDIEKAKMNALSSIFGSISDLMETVGEENEEWVRASKILALAEVAIKQGVAIAEAVAASAAGDPYTYALRVAAAIASTVAAMATAIKSIKSAKFATGGKVRGKGTKTSDSIPARLSDGEVVVNANSAEQYPTLLHEINTANGGADIPHPEQLTDAEKDFVDRHKDDEDEGRKGEKKLVSFKNADTPLWELDLGRLHEGQVLIEEEVDAKEQTKEYAMGGKVETSKESHGTSSTASSKAFSEGGKVTLTDKERAFSVGGLVENAFTSTELLQAITDIGGGIGVPVQNQTFYNNTANAYKSATNITPEQITEAVRNGVVGGITPEQIAEAMRQMPPQEVAVKEIDRVNGRVDVIENLRNY